MKFKVIVLMSIITVGLMLGISSSFLEERATAPHEQNEEVSEENFNLKTSGWAMDVSLANVDASFIGEASIDESGYSVAGVGDVNNDSYDDFLIGAHYNDEGPGDNAGQTYLILGNASGWSMDVSLANANASFIGEANGDYSGRCVAGAGDVNNDGYDDFLIGAFNNSEGGSKAGQTYLILGKASGWSMDINLTSANASYIGEAAYDYSGYSIAGVGDVNNDDYDDFLIGAYNSSKGGYRAGQAYLILGNASGWSMDINLTSANASFIGEAANDFSGYSVAGVGDVNNDDYDDFLIGAFFNDEGGSSAGQTYLILGNASGWSMDINLTNANASFIGEAVPDWSGYSVAGAGDVNNDGYDDFLIGAHHNYEGPGDNAGQTYLILGKSYSWAMDTSLENADASYIGETAYDYSGYSVAGVGDVNNDGYDDFLIGAYGYDKGLGDREGQTYLILGKSVEIPNTSDDDDNSAQEGAIPGYDLLLLIGLFGILSALVVKKRLK